MFENLQPYVREFLTLDGLAVKYAKFPREVRQEMELDDGYELGTDMELSILYEQEKIEKERFDQTKRDAEKL